MKKLLFKNVAIVCLMVSFLVANQLFGQENLYRITDAKGQTVKFAEYDDANPFSEGLAAVKLGNFWGYIDLKGDIVLPKGKPFYYQNASTFSKNGLAVVQINDLYGFIDKTGREVIPPKYQEAYDFYDGKTTVVKLNDKYGLIDAQGNFLIPAKYEGINVSEKFAVVYNGEKFALFTENGQALTPFIYDNIGGQFGLILDNRIVVVKDGRSGFIDPTGKVVIPIQYEEVGRFSEGLVNYVENGKCGYMNAEGKVIVPPIYNSSDEFSEGLATVEKDGLWGFIDKTGAVVIPIIYSNTQKFADGITYVTKDEVNYYLNKKGEKVPEPTYPNTSNGASEPEVEPVREKMDISLNYPALQLKVEKHWEAFDGNATNGKIYNLQTNQLIGENVIFRKGKITEGKFYAQGRTLNIKKTEGIVLADLQKVIAAEAAKPIPVEQPAIANNTSNTTPPKNSITKEKKEENEKYIKLYEELLVLYNIADLDYEMYYLEALEFDINASNETERKANLEKKIKPFKDTVDSIIEKSNYLLKNDPYMKPETRKAFKDAIPKYQGMVEKLLSL